MYLSADTFSHIKLIRSPTGTVCSLGIGWWMNIGSEYIKAIWVIFPCRWRVSWFGQYATTRSESSRSCLSALLRIPQHALFTNDGRSVITVTRCDDVWCTEYTNTLSRRSAMLYSVEVRSQSSLRHHAWHEAYQPASCFLRQQLLVPTLVYILLNNSFIPFSIILHRVPWWLCNILRLDSARQTEKKII